MREERDKSKDAAKRQMDDLMVRRLRNMARSRVASRIALEKLEKIQKEREDSEE